MRYLVLVATLLIVSLTGCDARNPVSPKPTHTMEIIVSNVSSGVGHIYASERVMYCHRKFGPPSKTRLWYNIHLLKRSIRWCNENAEASSPSFRSEIVLEALGGESSQAEVCRRHNLSEDQVSTWKQQFFENPATLFEPANKQSDASADRGKHPNKTLT